VPVALPRRRARPAASITSIRERIEFKIGGCHQYSRAPTQPCSASLRLCGPAGKISRFAMPARRRQMNRESASTDCTSAAHAKCAGSAFARRCRQEIGLLLVSPSIHTRSPGSMSPRAIRWLAQGEGFLSWGRNNAALPNRSSGLLPARFDIAFIINALASPFDVSSLRISVRHCITELIFII